MKEKKDPTVVDVLRRMKALLEKGWAQGFYAYDDAGHRVDHLSPKAVSFCLMGARLCAVDKLSAAPVTSATARELIRDCIPDNRDQIAFNDAKGRTKEDVLAVVDCAIKKASVATTY